MEPSIIAIILCIAGATLGMIQHAASLKLENKFAVQSLAPNKQATFMALRTKSAMRLLSGFLLIVFIFGVITLYLYRDQMIALKDDLLFGAWLFLAMVGGMFIQVISSNYQNGKDLFEVTLSQLIYPLLFSIIVYYPVWVIAASATSSFFAIYAAFLNGFFWRTVVDNTQIPMPPQDSTPPQQNKGNP